jgi:predicted ATPase/DNA-binding CsgD family transcriptional regulator
MSERNRVADPGTSPGSGGPTWTGQGITTATIRRTHHNLPVDLTRFVGREAELAEVKRLLSSTRLLTLAGSGGVGKTRLALKVAGDVVDQYRDGVWLVELAPLADTALVPKAVALALGVPEQTGRPLHPSLVDALRARQLLLVLDNCEHLVQACVELAEPLLRACPSLRILATSRQSLRVPGEITWRVPPMAVPSSVTEPTRESLDRYDATWLFVERAVAAFPGLVITQPAAATITRICSRLDGIPLAIELAAARLTVLSLAQIDQRLNDRFRLLTEGYRTELPRQQTLRAAVDWSFDLLSEKEQTLFRRLAVFAGGWTIESAEAVGADDSVQPEDILDLLSSLVDKSLVLVDQQSADVRYWLLETLREYGRGKLRAAGEETTTRRRHRDFYVDVARHAEPMLHRHEQVTWFERLDREHDNLRAVLAWCQAHVEDHTTLVELARRLWWFWYQRGHIAEGSKWLQAALSVTGERADRVDLLLGAGFLAYGQANLEQAEGLFAESLELARAIADEPRIGRSLAYLSMTLRDRGDLDRPAAMLDETLTLYLGADPVDVAFDVAFALYFQGRVAIRRGDVERAADLFDEGLRGFRRLGDRYGMALCLHELGNVALERGDNDSAGSLFAEVLVVSGELGFPRGICFALQGHATVARRRGDLERATALCRELLERWRLMGSLAFIARSLEELAAIAEARQESERCARLLGAATVLRDESKMPMTRLDRRDLDYDRLISSAQARLGPEVFAAAWEIGRATPLDAISEYAFQVSDSARAAKPSSAPPSPTHTPASLLSAREREVAALVAEGYSNRAIADALVIAPRTVDTHVSNILSKLDLRSRAQIAAWSVEHGLVTQNRR